MTGAPPGPEDRFLDSPLFEEMSDKEVKRLFRYLDRREFVEKSTIFIE